MSIDKTRVQVEAVIVAFAEAVSSLNVAVDPVLAAARDLAIAYYEPERYARRARRHNRRQALISRRSDEMMRREACGGADEPGGT